MKKVFVTGADGLLGSNLTRVLISRNYEVLAFVEAGRKPETIMGLQGVRFVEGNLLNAQAISDAIGGCDYVIHVAAITNLFPSRSPIMVKINVDGTNNIIEACIKHNIKRLVYVGSASTFGGGSIEKPGDENTPFGGTKYGLDYLDTKFTAHVNVVNACRTRGLNAVIACPTFMFGKYDSKPGPGAMLIALKDGKIPGYTSGGKNYVHVNDVAIGIANALEMGRVGESYILGNVNLNYKDAFSLMAETIGAKAPRIKLPDWATLGYGALNSMLFSLFKITPTVSYPMAQLSIADLYYSPAKAIKELQLPQTPLKKAIADCYDWMKERDMLEKKK